MFIDGIEVTENGVHGSVRYEIPRARAKTRMAERLVEWDLPEWLAQFLNKNAKYASVDTDLGPAGIIPDINRKTGILKGRIWFDEPVVGEVTTEVIDDLIGHLFLLRHMLIEEAALDGTAQEHGPSALRVVGPPAVIDPEAFTVPRRPVRDNPQA